MRASRPVRPRQAGSDASMGWGSTQRQTDTACQMHRRDMCQSSADASDTECRQDRQVCNLQCWLEFAQYAKPGMTEPVEGVSRQDLLSVGHRLHNTLKSWLVRDARIILGSVSGSFIKQQQLWAWYDCESDDDVLQLLLYNAVCTHNIQLVHRLLDEGVTPNPSSSRKLPDADTVRTVLHHYVPPHKVCYSVDPQAAIQPAPVLALAIVLLDHHMTHLLVGRGADPYFIPAEFYLPPMREQGLYNLPEAADDSMQAARASWCSEHDRELLQQALNISCNNGLTMGYWLARATKLPSLSTQAYSVMKAHQLQGVPALRMAVPGQEAACCLLYNQVMVYFGMSGEHHDSHKHKPLVLLLAGPPGHGKTWIGQQLQYLLNVPYHFEDCSKLHHTVSLLGAEGSFKDSERQPSFAAFIRSNSGKRSVVVLDEFEKMGKKAQDSLLGLLQDGRIVDPFSQELVNCCKTIFLLTTNAADRQIFNYWEEHSSSIFKCKLQPSVLLQQLRPLDKLIRAAVASRTSRSVTSRVTGVIPFFPFTEFEGMVVTQQPLLNLQQDLKPPVNAATGRTYGEITLELKDQPQVLRKLYKELYIPEEGARAIVNGVTGTVTLEIKSALLDGGCQLLAVG